MFRNAALSIRRKRTPPALNYTLGSTLFNVVNSHSYVLGHGVTVDPVVDRVERADTLGCFVDRLDRLHRLVDDFTT